MNHNKLVRVQRDHSIPRVSGDEPKTLESQLDYDLYSPRERG